MTNRRRLSVWLILLCNGISIIAGVALDGSSRAGTMNFRAVYYGARCLSRHVDPYKPDEFLRVYRAEGGEFPPEESGKSSLFLRAVPICVNLPTTLVLLAPFAMLGWGSAHILWLILISAAFTCASLLAWDLASDYAPIVSLVLVCVLAINNEVLFTVGNTAGIAVGFCVSALWCFVRGRFALLGVVFLAVSLCVKPHDSGLVWLSLLLSGGVWRKRALQSLILTAIFAVPAVLWVSRIAPDWRQELQGNLAATSVHGDISDPGPDNASRRSSADILIDFQSVVSVFKDEPRVYNAVTYLICGLLLTVWAVATLRNQATLAGVWLGLAFIANLSIIVTYHRPYDAKILLLSVPARAQLWSQREKDRANCIWVEPCCHVDYGRYSACGTFHAHQTHGCAFNEHRQKGFADSSIAAGPHSIANSRRILLMAICRDLRFYDRRWTGLSGTTMNRDGRTNGKRNEACC